jgi:hypothetical protein
MAIAISILLIAGGAILNFAVSKTVDGVALDTVGIILMIAGAGGLVISLAVLGTARVREGRTTVMHGATPVQAGTTVVKDGAR